MVIYQKKDEEIQRINADNLKQKQVLVNEFKQVQDMMKDKIIQTEQEYATNRDFYFTSEFVIII
jgi:CHASE3 domain sensor protein